MTASEAERRRAHAKTVSIPPPSSRSSRRALLAFAIEFERESDVSLAINANVVRVLDENGVPVRDLPLLTGVSKEAISMAMGILQKKGIARSRAGPSSSSRTKVARLTRKGREAQDAYHRLPAPSKSAGRALRRGNVGSLGSPLEQLGGRRHYAEFASVPWIGAATPTGGEHRSASLTTLPHYPMVLHRGGFPDGS